MIPVCYEGEAITCSAHVACLMSLDEWTSWKTGLLLVPLRRTWLALRPPVEYRRFIMETGTVAAPGV